MTWVILCSEAQFEMALAIPSKWSAFNHKGEYCDPHPRRSVTGWTLCLSRGSKHVGKGSNLGEDYLDTYQRTWREPKMCHPRNDICCETVRNPM